MSVIWIKLSDWLKIVSGCGILIYSAGQGFISNYFMYLYFFLFFANLVTQYILYANDLFLSCSFWKCWPTIINVVLALMLLWHDLSLSDIITNARTILVNSFIECNSFIIATLCPNLLQKHVLALRQYRCCRLNATMILSVFV